MKKKNSDDFIEASKIKPGMIIGIKRRVKYDDIVLVIAKTGFVKVDYTYFDYQDSYGGPFCGGIDGKEKVKVITGERRQHVFNHIKNDIFKNLHDVEHSIDTIRLIESMDSSLK